MNVADEEEVKSAVAACIAAFGRIDVLMNSKQGLLSVSHTF